MPSEQVRRAMQMAKDIIDQEWIAAGMTREQLDMDEKVIALLDAFVGAGYPMEDLLEEWQTKTHEQFYASTHRNWTRCGSRRNGNLNLLQRNTATKGDHSLINVTLQLCDSEEAKMRIGSHLCWG